MAIEMYLLYSGYLIWLLAGFGDFLFHRRTDLPHTSGVLESGAHLLQLGLLGAAILLALAFKIGPVTVLLLVVLVTTHACVGYLDTHFAFTRQRTVLPMEQHLHSILDMAPIIALGLLVWSAWPIPVTVDGWNLQIRQPARAAAIWWWVIVPALLLCVLPALMEFRAAWASRFAANQRNAGDKQF